jgi:hypothetical protein
MSTKLPSRKLLELLIELQKLKSLENFALAGGSGLALYLSHRESDDIDLFSEAIFDADKLLSELKLIGEIKERNRSENIFQLLVNGLPVDIVSFPYPSIEPTMQIDGMRVFALADLAAMKLNAISRRGTKRDFVDLYFLLEKYSLVDLITFFHKRFPSGSIAHVVRSLSYFEDAERDPMPKMIVKTSWSDVKQSITEAIRNIDLRKLNELEK